jgi:type I restriction enzyme S subunit
MKNDWQIKKLGEVLSIVTGKLDANAAVDGGRFPFYTCSQGDYSINETAFDGESILLSGNGIFTVKYHKSGKFNAYQRVYVIQSKTNEVYLKYIYFFLVIEVPKLISQGGVIKYLRLPQLTNLEIPLPPFKIQKEIVAKLDEKFAKLREAKRLREEVIVDTEKILSQTLREIFEEGKQKGWEEIELQKVVEITSSKRIYKSDYVTEGVPFYRTKEISELDDGRDIKTELFISEAKFKEVKDKFGAPKEGDLLLTAIGTIGKMYVVQKDHKFYFKDGNILWLRNFKNIDSDFLKLVLRLGIQGMQDLSAGSAYKALPIIKLKKMEVALPSVAEQQKIVTKLDKLSEKIRTLRELQTSQLTDLKHLEKSYLHEAFNGELM